MVVTDRKLKTAVAYVTGLYILVIITLRYCDRTEEGLLAGIRLIECHIQSQSVVEEACGKTGFP